MKLGILVNTDRHSVIPLGEDTKSVDVVLMLRQLSGIFIRKVWKPLSIGSTGRYFLRSSRTGSYHESSGE